MIIVISQSKLMQHAGL